MININGQMSFFAPVVVPLTHPFLVALPLQLSSAGDFACLGVHTDDFAFLDKKRHAHG